MNKDATILVTGAAGFIGSHLVRKLVRDGFRVTALVKNTSDLWRIKDIASAIDFCEADVLDFDNLKQQLETIKPQGVFHLAASNIRSGITAPDADVVNINILGTRNLLQAMASMDYDFFVNMGSFLEYGPKPVAVREDALCSPTELYSVTKLAATLYGQTVAKNNNRPVITFRLFTPYGPTIQPGRLVYELVNRALKNEEINLTKPKIARDFIYVEDLVELLVESADKARDYKGEVFNAGSGQAVSLEQLAHEVLKITASHSKIKWGSFSVQAYDTELWQADMMKTWSHFKWRPKYSLADGLAATADWFRNNQVT
ncbi:MAG: SDR family NAD(P)-dependent oxidoreductase [bacterium]|nr:SDR family NAD(P)-dependent oxidoreductase [bacterium]